MTGYTSMMLGGFAFEALGFSFQDIKRRVQTPWVEIPVAQVLSPQQWTGPKSDDLTIRGVLFPEEFGGQSQLDGIVAAALGGVPLMLVSGDMAQGVVHGVYTVQSVDMDGSLYDARGNARRNAYSIALKLYGDSARTSAANLVERALSSLVDLLR